MSSTLVNEIPRPLRRWSLVDPEVLVEVLYVPDLAEVVYPEASDRRGVDGGEERKRVRVAVEHRDDRRCPLDREESVQDIAAPCPGPAGPGRPGRRDRPRSDRPRHSHPVRFELRSRSTSSGMMAPCRRESQSAWLCLAQ